jgi:transposase
VYNDALRVRQEAYHAGVTLSDSEIQRQVITVAKTTERRAWLAEVSSVALVQSVNDSRRSFRNYFDSCTGKRKGRKMGRPRMKSKRDSRQSFRLARTGFRLRPNGRLYVAKVGELRVRWSRDLPSEPSSVTIIREPDGKYYASFVVDIPATPLPEVEREAGVDVGIARLATIVDTAGIGEKAEKFGRTVLPVSRWLPSSKTCNECGHVLDDLPLHVRQWACPVCEAVHDRDHNAAKNILAAGRAERLNACGALVSPPDAEVRGDEAGSTPDAA